MRYVTSIERLALQEGLEQGLEQGSLRTARENVLDILNLRFKDIPRELTDVITNMVDLPRLKELLREAVSVGSLEEFERSIEGDDQQ